MDYEQDYTNLDIKDNGCMTIPVLTSHPQYNRKSVCLPKSHIANR